MTMFDFIVYILLAIVAGLVVTYILYRVLNQKIKWPLISSVLASFVTALTMVLAIALATKSYWVKQGYSIGTVAYVELFLSLWIGLFIVIGAAIGGYYFLKKPTMDEEVIEEHIGKE